MKPLGQWEGAVIFPTFALVGCGKTKSPRACPARDLYTGNLFRAARNDVDARGLPWAIASAEHGILLPETVTEPYDLTIAQRRAEDVQAYGGWGRPGSWPDLVAAQLVNLLWWGQVDRPPVAPRGTPVVLEIHAGAPYVDAIRNGLEHHVAGAEDPERRRHRAAPLLTIVDPCAGLQIGERLAFYAARRGPAQIPLFRGAA